MIRESMRIGPDLSGRTNDLEHVLSTWLGDADRLARYGHGHEAAIIGALVRDVELAAKDWLDFLSESAAMRRSRHGVAWFRQRFKKWEQDGHARIRNGKREYRAAVVPIVEADPIAESARAAANEAVYGKTNGGRR